MVTSDDYIADLAENFHKLVKDKIREEWAEILIQIPNISTANILDAGCGSGLYTKPLRALTKGEVFGIDLTEDMLKIAEKEQENITNKIIYKQADLNNDICKVIERDPEYFDVINSCWVLQHAQSPEMLCNMIKNIGNALKKGGVFVGITRNTEMTLQDIEELENYGNLYQREDPKIPLRDGEKMRIKVIDPATKEPLWEVENYYYSREIYMKAFTEAGFSKVDFTPQRRPKVLTGSYYLDEVTQDGILFKAYK